MASTAEPYAELKETHSAVVLLVGDHVLKMKKPVALGFLDFSARVDRLTALRRELELNRRLAPDVYLGVSDLNGTAGMPVDHVLIMRRLPDDLRLAQLVRSGVDVTSGVHEIAEVMTAFHRRCERGAAIDREGSRDALQARWSRNLEHMRRHVGEQIDTATHDEIRTLARAYLCGREDLFAARIAAGAIVDGHGDLLADDVFLMPDGPRILDCLEFDDHLPHVDVMDDVAALAADLERLGAAPAADEFISSYRRASGERCPESLLHHFIAYRAFVRAMVACEPGAAEPGSAAVLVRLAHRHLIQGRIHLLLVGGTPGTGKTTVARACGSALGWTVLRSDEVRKELAGIGVGEHAPAAIGEGIYTADWNRRTYAELLRRAERHLSMGESVILDATWSTMDLRERAASLARSSFSDFVQIRCEVPPDVAAQRISIRRGDASDADADVAADLRARFEEWPDAIPLDTMRPMEEVLSRIRERVEAR